MNFMKLIHEDIFCDYEIINEQKNPDAPKFLKIKGPYIVTEKKNINGRIYSRELMIETVKEFKTNWIDTKRAYAELNHPNYAVIDPTKACDLCTSLEQDKNDPNIWIGESVVCSTDHKHNIIGTPNGDIVASLLQHGGRIGKSTRGVGQISEASKVDKNYKLITIDTVVDPSGPGCFVEGILESKNFMINNYGDIVEMAYDSFENGIKNIPGHSTKTLIGEAYVVGLFDNFIKNINKGK